MNSTTVLAFLAGVFLGVMCVALLQRCKDPFDVSIGHEYDKAFGTGPVTQVPELDWTEWGPGDASLPPGVGVLTSVWVRFRNGEGSSSPSRAGNLYWRHTSSPWDIVAYRVCR